MAARYLVTGGLAAAADIAAFSMLLPLELGLPLTATLSFLVGSIVNYWTSASFVFDSPRSMSGYSRFLAGALVGLALNVGLTVWLAAALPPIVAQLLPADAAARLPDVATVAKVIAIAASTVFNFAINLLIVFKPRV